MREKPNDFTKVELELIKQWLGVYYEQILKQVDDCPEVLEMALDAAKGKRNSTPYSLYLYACID